MYYNYDGTPNFDRMNRETREHSKTNIDRYNPSTRGNYNFFDPCRQNYLNNQTYRQNNGAHSKKYF